MRVQQRTCSNNERLDPRSGIKFTATCNQPRRPTHTALPTHPHAVPLTVMAAASRSASLRISFSGAGFLGAWHLGTWAALDRAALTSRAEVAGASAGAIVGALLVSDAPLSLARKHLLSLSAKCRSQPLGVLTPGYSLVDEMREALTADMPLDAHQRATGRLHVALTSLRKGEVGRVRHKSSFSSRDELIDAISASSDIPGITGRVRASVEMPPTSDDSSTDVLLQRWLRRHDVDGGLCDIFPDPWADEERAANAEGRSPAAGGVGGHAQPVVFVSPFAGTGFAIAPERRGAIITLPQLRSKFVPCPSTNSRSMDLTMENLQRWKHTFVPPDEATLLEYEVEGRRAADRWLASRGARAPEDARTMCQQ